MATGAQKDANCHKFKFSNFAKAVAQKAATALWRLLCNQLKTLATSLRTLIQGQLLVLEPIVGLRAVFLENFVVFPAEAVSSTIGTVGDTSKKFREFGFDKSCSSHKTIHTSAERATAKLTSTKRFFDNTARRAKARIEKDEKFLEEMRESILTLFDFDNLQCQ